MADTIPNVHPSRSSRDAFRTIRAVQLAHRVTGPARAVLYALAVHADGPSGRHAWPSIATLASESGLSRTTVKDTLAILEDAGVIRRGDQSRAPRRPGRPVTVWDVALDVLYTDFGPTAGAADPQKSPRGASPGTTSATTGRGAALQRDACRPVEGAGADHELPGELPDELPPPLVLPSRQAAPGADEVTEQWMSVAADHLMERGGDSARPPDLQTLLAALESGGVTHPAKWLAVCLQRRPPEKRGPFLRSLWLSDVEEYDDDDDADRLRAALAEGGYEDFAEEMDTALRAQGVLNPGLYVQTVALGGPAGVAALAGRVLF